MATIMEAAPQEQANSTKRVPGRPFVKGQSGCPTGRPPKSKALRELERVTREQATVVLERLAGPALKVLQKALASRDTNLAVKAAIDVLDRTQGRAVQKIDASISANETVRTADPATLLMAARRLLASTAVDAQVVEPDAALSSPVIASEDKCSS